MTDGANTPASEPADLGLLGPATLLAIRTGVRACDRDLEIYAALAQRRDLTRNELVDRAKAHATRSQLLTQPYPQPYEPGREHGANVAGSHSGQEEPV